MMVRKIRSSEYGLAGDISANLRTVPAAELCNHSHTWCLMYHGDSVFSLSRFSHHA